MLIPTCLQALQQNKYKIFRQTGLAEFFPIVNTRLSRCVLPNDIYVLKKKFCERHPKPRSWNNPRLHTIVSKPPITHFINWWGHSPHKFCTPQWSQNRKTGNCHWTLNIKTKSNTHVRDACMRLLTQTNACMTLLGICTSSNIFYRIKMTKIIIFFQAV